MKMKYSLEEYMTNFLRTYTEPFTAKEFSNGLNSLGFDVSTEEVSMFLSTDCRVFSLQRNMFITRAGAFLNQVFSFVPSQRELEQKLFIPGDRFMPFADSEIPSSTLRFEFLGHKLPTKIFNTDCNYARELFTLYGDEYISQYIAADPACKNLNLAENNFELPPKLSLTGIALDEVLAREEFNFSGRFFARVKNWDKGIIEIFPIPEYKENPFQMDEIDVARQKWNETLENALLDSFERMGPCSSMEEQLANVFYENRKKLCVPSCGSISEFLHITKKVSLELFGVETRLWRAGEEIPAVGSWNDNTYGVGCDGTLPFYVLPDYIIDNLLKDQLHEKREDLSEIVKKLQTWQGNLSQISPDVIGLHVQLRNKFVKKNYNWFADFSNTALRKKALDLYSRVRNLLHEMDCDDGDFQKLPQQELITLSQLFTHISRILEILADDEECPEEETYAMTLSLEGMDSNFEDIKPLLISAADSLKKKRFNVI